MSDAADETLAGVAEALGNPQLRRQFSQPYERTAQVAQLVRLLDKERANVLLVGEPGSGKTTVLVEAVRQLERAGERRGRHYWQTGAGRLIAGMKYLGQWEERCETVVAEPFGADHLVTVHSGIVHMAIHTYGVTGHIGRLEGTVNAVHTMTAVIDALSRVEFRHAQLEALGFEDEQFDLVVGDASLVGPERLPEVLAEMVRVATRGATVAADTSRCKCLAGVQTWASWSGAMPGPSSATASTSDPLLRAAVSRTAVPRGA